MIPNSQSHVLGFVLAELGDRSQAVGHEELDRGKEAFAIMSGTCSVVHLQHIHTALIYGVG